MRIIKLNAIDSTNTFLRQLSNAEVLEDYTVVVAESQTNGRGQMGTTWYSQPSKNLIASVFVDVSFLSVEDSFYISMAISLAISNTLKNFQIKQVKVKWPNDILADQKKISGVLIENVIKNNKLNATIIGFGLNVNQINFENLPQAASMQMVSGVFYDLDQVLQAVIKHLKTIIEMLKRQQFENVKALYEAELFRKNKPSTFENVEGEMFPGFIKGVSNTGHLQVLLEDNILKEFDLKEVKLLY
ncbi:biotin--[acetyl-CoA-carboxylase] ligase [Psychroserpens luteolus]|uniref:biotin--[acetyl-CoA-carboxylase] ligase n=1 Tax=Psychroserpens luteolus TaxID=2855840 RepID=UPI001E3906E7|nr:biotin--[acetyl-CoA-carboxylase] ligase [Psychroserpens luteolus]MCD2260553.1 biotin--[acetyl-CoA-carboxylase] ligase [Psychroserpens luteolus]